VGEGGCDAAYFLDKMGIGEARSYIAGLNRRHRQEWEQTRLLCRLIHKIETGKDFDMELPWDEEDDEAEGKSQEQHDAELEQARQRARELEKFMKERKKKDEEDKMDGQVGDAQG
jgi:hypothetical protein